MNRNILKLCNVFLLLIVFLSLNSVTAHCSDTYDINWEYSTGSIDSREDEDVSGVSTSDGRYTIAGTIGGAGEQQEGNFILIKLDSEGNEVWK